ncbi:MAG: outer membrane beta-barrel protein [Candidatus Omnitrophota bacterium]|nr:outer membrane beta-barrel protein [Candidatus Omnitrophota bacterium]
MRKAYPVFIFIIFVNLLCAPFLYAQEKELRPEKPKLSPWGEVKLQYDDNVFLTSDNEKSDFIVTLTPGVTAYLPFSDNLLKLDYHVDFNRFMDNTSQNATNHFLSGNLELNLRDLTFNIYDDFSRSFERPSTEDTTRVKRDDNRAGITANLQKDRLGIQLGYENFRRDYKSNPSYDQYDRTENIYSLMATHQTFSKTKLLLEYDFGDIKYDHSDTNSDSNYHQLLVGAIGELTPKTTATIKLGGQFRHYKDSAVPNFNTGVIYSDITHKFSDRDYLKLSLLRTASESTYSTNSYYRLSDIHGTYDHFFTLKLLGFLTGIYQEHSYPRESTEGAETKKRNDKYYSTGAGLKYYLQKWLTMTFQIEHIIRNSNFNVFEYKENLVTLSAKAVF